MTNRLKLPCNKPFSEIVSRKCLECYVEAQRFPVSDVCPFWKIEPSIEKEDPLVLAIKCCIDPLVREALDLSLSELLCSAKVVIDPLGKGLKCRVVVRVEEEVKQVLGSIHGPKVEGKSC